MGFGLDDSMVQRLTITRLGAADEQALGFKLSGDVWMWLFCHGVNYEQLQLF